MADSEYHSDSDGYQDVRSSVNDESEYLHQGIGPYQFEPSGSEVSERERVTITGMTIAWRQQTVLQEFCKISMSFIRKGANPKVYQSASQKLTVSPDMVQHGVEGLMYLLTESSKLMLNEIDFQDSILTLGFSEDVVRTLLELYLGHRQEIRSVLSEMAMDLPHYHDLEWRFDVQLASRSLRRQTTPQILCKLHLKDCGSDEKHVFVTDPVNLVHMTKVLEQALQEMKSPYCRRIVRNIK